MKILEIEQRSDEWTALRRSKIGASDCAPVCGHSRYRSPRMVWKEKVHGIGSRVSPAMQKGIDLEPEARAYFEKKLALQFEPMVAIHDDHPWMMASFDGWNADTLLEIKVVGKTTFEGVDNGFIPPEYDWQVQHQMFVAGADRAVLGFFHKEEEIKTVEVLIGRDEEMIKELLEKESYFYNVHMLGYTEPDPTDLDSLERRDPAWYDVAIKFRGVKERRESLEREEKALRERLVELANGESCVGYGVKATRYKMEGRIDYKKIPQLEGLDLSPYRSESTISWRISCD